MQEKKCSKCGVTKPLGDFYPHNRSKDGHTRKCKLCVLKENSPKYPNGIPEKACLRCGKVKPLFEFNRSRRNKDGRDGSCKDCFNTNRQLVREGKLPNQKQIKESVLALLVTGFMVCHKCHETKPVSEFHKSSSQYTGLSSWCRKCTSDFTQAQRDVFVKNYDKSKVPEHKFCRRCGKTKPSSEFNNAPSKRDGLMDWCRNCLNTHTKIQRSNLPESVKHEKTVRRHGIDLDEYNRILESQNGVCAICGNPERVVANGKVRNLAVDHSHTPGNRVRGILCQECNHGIGNFKDNPVLLLSAIEYLRKYSVEKEQA